MRQCWDEFDNFRDCVDATFTACLNIVSATHYSDAFNLISPTIPVLICPQHHRDIFDRALSDRDWNTLNRFSVGFYPNEVTKFDRLLLPIDPAKPEFGYVWIGEYDFGLVMNHV